MEKDQLIDYLLAQAQLNDSLLQSYRQIHLTIQSIFLAIGVGLSVAITTFKECFQIVLTTLTLTLLAGISLYILFRLREIITARGEDVSFWHRKLILAEQSLPPDQRFFTEFKIYQKLQRVDANHLRSMFLTDKRIEPPQIDTLVEKGLGHTRRVLDKWLFAGISVMWVFLLGIGVGYVVYCLLSLSF